MMNAIDQKIHGLILKSATVREKAINLQNEILDKGNTPERMVEFTKTLNEMEKLLKELEYANAEKENAIQEEARWRMRSARLNGDPHFVGFDGKRYDVMPGHNVILFEANAPRNRLQSYPQHDLVGKDFCVTGLHKTFDNKPEGPDVPSWTTGVFIKLYGVTIFYDVDGNLLCNGVPAPIIHIFKDGSYYYLDDTDRNHKLVVWHPTFGRVVVDNCEGFNLNITLVLPESITQVTSSTGIMLSKEINKNIWKNTQKMDTSMFQKLKEQYPGLCDEDIMNLLFDYQFTPKNIRDIVLQANSKSVVKQIDIIKNETDKPRINIGEKKSPCPGARAHFSGALMGDAKWGNVGTRLFVEDQYSEIVGEGDYASSLLAFPKAIKSSFDSIAVDRGTRVVIYPQPNFKGSPLLDIQGPCILWNHIYQKMYTQEYKWFLSQPFEQEEFQSIFPISVRKLSSGNMNDWNYGSIKISRIDDELNSLFTRFEIANDKFNEIMKRKK